MALTLQQIRDFVRLHMDIEVEDLPDQVLDVFIREGSKRVEKAESRWPFYEQSWTLNTASGVRAYPLTSLDVDQLTNVQTDQWNLAWIGREKYDVLNPSDATSTSQPTAWTRWGDDLLLWPTPDAVYELTLRGYRTPIDWVANGAGAEPDLPDELHNTVATWALARAYAQQEDPELAGLFEQQFHAELGQFSRRIRELPHTQPMVLNSRSAGRPSPFGRMRFDFEV